MAYRSNTLACIAFRHGRVATGFGIHRVSRQAWLAIDETKILERDVLRSSGESHS